MNRPEVYRITSEDDMPTMHARIARAVLDVFDVAMRYKFRPQDSGGVLLTGYDGMFRDGDTPFMTIVGYPKRLTVEESLTAAAEKFQRLYDRPIGDISAWESRDPAAEPKQWGGAIIAGYDQDLTIIMAFSGCSEYADESFLAIAGQLCGILDVTKAKRICDISENALYLSLYDAVMEEQYKVSQE